VKATAAERQRFSARSPEEVLMTCRAWENYIHPRAQNFWESSERLNEVLSKIARGVDKLGDPLLGDEKRCVFWHGSMSPDDGLPVVHTVKPGESQESQMYVIRILVFFFCDEDSFLELKQKQIRPFDMLCDEPTCVNLSHVALD